MKPYRIFCLLAMMVSMVPIFAQEQDSVVFFTIDFSFQETSLALEEQVIWWEDTLSRVVREEASRQDFKPYSELDKASLTPGGTMWGKLFLVNPKEDTVLWVLVFGTADTVECFTKQNGEWHSAINGANIKVSEREMLFGQFASFEYQVAPGDSLEIIFRSREVFEETPVIQARVYSQFGLSEIRTNRFMTEVSFVGMFQSILLIMLLYNFMIFISTRQITYFWYALYLLSLVGALYFDNTVRILPQLGFDAPWINNFAAGLMLTSTSAWYFLFGRSFLNSKVILPKWDKIMLILIGIRVLFLIGLTIVQLSDPRMIGGLNVHKALLVMEILFLLVFFFRLAKVGGALVWFFILGSGVVFVFGFMQLILREYVQINTFLFFLGSVLVEILIFSLGLGYRMRKSQQDKLAAEQSLNQELSKINTAFGRFVPHEFLENLGRKDILEVALGDQVERKVTVLFSDMRGYTNLSEQMTPKENFDFLNGYLGRVGPIIQENGGFVNQYYGDGIMALFMGKAEEAVAAAISIQQAVAVYNLERIAKNRLPIKIGIGIHSGSLMMGVIGDTLRMDAGVVSDSVNTASRMEGLTKQFGVNILLSETAASQLPETVPLRSLGKVLVKGRKAPIGIYDCYGGDAAESVQAKSATASQHEEALRFYLEKSFAQALRIWDELREEYPEDQVLIRFQALCKQCLLEGVPEEWAGVEEMQEK